MSDAVNTESATDSGMEDTDANEMSPEIFELVDKVSIEDKVTLGATDDLTELQAKDLLDWILSQEDKCNLEDHTKRAFDLNISTYDLASCSAAVDDFQDIMLDFPYDVDDLDKYLDILLKDGATDDL